MKGEKKLESYHPVVQKIVSLLSENNFWFETFEHEAVRTSEEAARVRPGYTIKQGTKAIIVRVKKSGSEKYFAMLVLPGDARFNTDVVKKVLSAKDIRFATLEEVAGLTGGIIPGGVPPFGNLFSLPVVAEPAVLENEKIVFNAGDRRFSVAMMSQDYLRLVKPTISPLL